MALDSTTIAACEEFCREHMQAESQHLALMESILQRPQQTKLVPLWRTSGFYLGFFPTLLLGPAGLYSTVRPVESFVVEHYTEQFVPLEAKGGAPCLAAALRVCCEDEAHHRDEAAANCGSGDSALQRAWSVVVKAGSAAAAEVARVV